MEKSNIYKTYLYKSNTPSALLNEVLGIFKKMTGNNLFGKKTVIAQTEAMQRWLALKIAEEHGIAANIEFVSPDEFLRNFAEKYFGIKANDSVFNRKNTEWALYSIFKSDALEKPEFLPIKNYIKNNAGRAFGLCRKIADLFEQYAVYRPHIIENWEKGVLSSDLPDEIWQKEIFMELKRLDSVSDPDFTKLFIEKCSNTELDENDRNPLILFGISQMNRHHLNMFLYLSLLLPVHIFAVQPSKEYVYKPGKETFFRRFCASDIEITDFFAENSPFKETELFIQPTNKTMLSSIQRDILKDTEEPEKIGTDDSLRISACCGKMREMEVLKDSLLELFKNNENLFPEDIAVLCPDLKSYEPYINAVFGNVPANDKTFIPFVIGEGQSADGAKISETFLKIIRLNNGKYTKSEILSIFKEPFVCGKFGVSRNNFQEIENLVNESGIKWGKDNAFIQEKYEFSGQNTWEFGLNRIMLSSFIPFSENGNNFKNILPIENFQGDKNPSTEGFISFIQELLRFSDNIAKEKTPSEFKSLLEKALDFFFLNDKNSLREIRRIKNIIGNFAERADKYLQKIPFDAVRIYLEDEISRSTFHKHSIGSKLCFSSLKEMHCLPFRVVCLIGMDEESFPRKDAEYAFDLTRKVNAVNGEPKIRSLRENDFHLFLDAIISAGEKLIISYDAKELREDSKKHRSAAMPVKILEKYMSEKAETELKGIETKYPVLPFSAEYFAEENHFVTFSKENFKIAEKLFHVKPTPQDLFESNEKEKIQEHLTLSLNDLLSFFKDPQKYYFTKVLKLVLPDTGKNSEDEEIFDYDDTLLNYNIRQTYLNMSYGLPDEETVDRNFIRRMKGEGKIAAGAIGEEKLKNVVKSYKIRNFAEKLYEENLNHCDFSFDLNDLGVTLYGRIENLQKEHAVTAVMSPLKTKHKIQSEIRHLAMNAAGIALNTRVYTLDSKKEFVEYILPKIPADHAKSELSVFVKLWKQAQKNMPVYNDKVFDVIDKSQNVASAIETAAADKFALPYFLFMEELFKLNEKHFSAEFPHDEIKQINVRIKQWKKTKQGNK